MGSTKSAFNQTRSIPHFPDQAFPETSVRKKRNVRVRTVMAAVGVKGLRDSKSEAFKETESDLNAIRELESLSPDAQESVDFILSANP